MSLRKLLLFFLFCPIFIFSQNIKKSDSLLHILKTGTFSKEKHFKLLADIAFNHPDMDLALGFAKQSLNLAIEIKSPILQAEAWEEISHLENKLGNNSQSLKASLNALKTYKLLDMVESQAAVYTQISNNYISNKNYDEAINYLKKAIHIYVNSNNIKNHALTILNLGEVYRLKGYLDHAATTFRKVLELNEALNDATIKGYAKGNLGMVYNSQNKLDSAKTYLNASITNLNSLKDYYATSIYINELGIVYNKETKYQNAEDNFLRAFTMAEKTGLKEQVRDFSAQLSTFYEKRQHYSKALKYQKVFQVYQDSLVNKENIQKIEQLKAGYEIDKRESEISMLYTINSNQKNWVITLCIGLFLLILFIYLLHTSNKKIKTANITLSNQKNIITKREQEKVMLLRELNHRIKNNLQMISSLLNLQSHELAGHPAKEAIIAGKHRVEALSLVHRKLYQENLDTRIMLKDYIEELVLGLFHGYDASFKPSFKIDNVSVSLDIAVPLALIVNEIIINALKYAYPSIDKPKLKLIMLENKNSLNIQIIDNGTGFNTTDTKKSNSFGIKLIYSLIEQLQGVIKKLDSKNGTHWKMSIKIA